jgi:hypothetical protein
MLFVELLGYFLTSISTQKEPCCSPSTSPKYVETQSDKSNESKRSQAHYAAHASIVSKTIHIGKEGLMLEFLFLGHSEIWHRLACLQEKMDKVFGVLDVAITFDPELIQLNGIRVSSGGMYIYLVEQSLLFWPRLGSL